MWIKRDLIKFLETTEDIDLPIKVLRGPRQVGKTSLLAHLKTHKLILFDDLGIRKLAEETPSLFFDQFTGLLILDEATMAPEVFPELKKRVDQQRREYQETGNPVTIDIWITGSNQTLLQKAVRESLAGRANYYFLNTLSVHEIQNAYGEFSLERLFMRGGWPELYASPKLNAVQYLNDFIATFIEKDIVVAAGIEKRSAFSKALQLVSGRLGQLFNASDIAKNIGVDTSTLKAWVGIFEQNGILRTVSPYYSNLNQRLIKTPKIYFEDIGLAVRLQGWSEYEPILTSPYFGSLFENLVLIEIARFFTNRGVEPEIFFLRSKDQVEVDFLLQLPNQRYLAIEVKTTPTDLTARQLKLLSSLRVDIIEKWIISPNRSTDFENARVIPLGEVFEQLTKIL
ncbi:MAG: hypothetical protein S4CHLAM107_12100 [Chlamydiia bacterium]|nr:hypothetical protein [Chlamydiia bacterium]